MAGAPTPWQLGRSALHSMHVDFASARPRRPMHFPVVDVPYSDLRRTENMGTKAKFWYDDPVLGGSLFKAVRRGPGEDWSEKAAEQCASLLGIPNARYELAVHHDPERGTQLGVVSPRFLLDGEQLTHGNELLMGADATYALTAGATRATRSPQYTVPLVLRTLDESGAALPAGWSPPGRVATASDLFVGYLLTDAWLGNTDRHEQNWGVVESSSGMAGGAGTRTLAPYYDSASCLGRDERDDARLRRLGARDQRDTVETYARRGRSAFFDGTPEARPVSPLSAFEAAADVRPMAALAWLERLGSLADDVMHAVFTHFPPNRISEPARDFALALLHYNRSRLLALRPDLEAHARRAGGAE